MGSHNWTGCKCTACGKTRNEGHDWSKNCEKCAICGMTRSTRDEAHSWDGCKCNKCQQVRDEEHDWTKNCEMCARCGKTRLNAHSWDGCKCKKCGGEHYIDKCTCMRCGKTFHTWKNDECSLCGLSGSERNKTVACAKCGRTEYVNDFETPLVRI